MNKNMKIIWRLKQFSKNHDLFWTRNMGLEPLVIILGRWFHRFLILALIKWIFLFSPVKTIKGLYDHIKQIPITKEGRKILNCVNYILSKWNIIDEFGEWCFIDIIKKGLTWDVKDIKEMEQLIELFRPVKNLDIYNLDYQLPTRKKYNEK